VDERPDEAAADTGRLLCCECVDKYSDFRFLKVAFESDKRVAATRMVQVCLHCMFQDGRSRDAEEDIGKSCMLSWH
jgi:hypothetical protein